MSKENREVLVHVDHMKKYFPVRKKGVLKAVDDVSFNIYKGETLGLVGESGCGKTTCGRTVLGLYPVTEGTVEYAGKNVTNLKKNDLNWFKKRAQMIFLYFSAGLGNIDESIYERASVDGANGIQKFFRLTLPGLSPIMFYTLVVNIIQAFQSFGQIKILTAGGPGESTNVIVYSIYRDAFFNYKFGSAAAQSVVLFLIIMALTLVMFRIEKKGVKY